MSRRSEASRNTPELSLASIRAGVGGRPADHPRAEQIAEQFHFEYETLAPLFGYTTRELSACAWRDVPEHNKALMRATVTRLLDRGVIR